MNKLRQRLGGLDDGHAAIAKGMVAVVIFLVISKLLGAIKEAVVAYRYGVSAEVDAYIFVVNIVSWPVTVWFSVLTAVLVPLAAKLRQYSADELTTFRAEILALAMVLGFALMVLLWLGLPGLLHHEWLGLSADTARLAHDMAIPLAALCLIGMIIALLSAWMMAGHRHTNTLFEGIPALTIAVAVLISPSGGIDVLVWGTIAGFMLHAASLFLSLNNHGELAAPRFSRQSRYWTQFWQAIGIMLVGQAMINSIAVIDQAFAANIGAGAISTLNYANRILALLLGLGATAVARSALPVFSRAEALRSGHGWHVARQWALLLFVVGMSVMAIAWWCSSWLVKLLFERGAFLERDTVSVTEVLRYGLVQLPFFCSSMVLVAYASSRGFYKLLFVTGAVGFLLKVAANVPLIHYFGVAGISMAWSLVYMLNVVILWATIRRVHD